MIPAVAGNAITPVTPNPVVVPNSSAFLANTSTIGNLPTQAVPTTIALVESRNNFRAAMLPLADDKAQTSSNQKGKSDAEALLQRGTSAGGGSSAFLTQLLSQDPDSIILRGSAELETVAPTTMQVFSNIKYLPSNAAKPYAGYMEHAPSTKVSAKPVFDESFSSSRLSTAKPFASLQANEAYLATQALSSPVTIQ